MSINTHAWFQEVGSDKIVCMNCGETQTELNIDEYCDPSAAKTPDCENARDIA